MIKPSKGFRIQNVEELRSLLKSDHRIIDLYDLKSQSNYRKTISSVAKTSLSTPKFSAFLHLLINYLKIETVVESGTSFGINSLYMAGPETVKRVITIEASPIISAIAKEQFSKLLQYKIEIKEGTVQDTFESIIVKEQPQLCFIDADHRSNAIEFCINTTLTQNPTVKCIVIHDIYWSPDMLLIWKKLISDGRFNLTIDIFQAGLLFPNMEMPKQHFVLRF
ncbi:O-methyltransferase [Ekhidna sp.]